MDKHNPVNIPLLNLCNEAVSNEISRSTQTVLNAFANDGKYIAPRAPYGYCKSPDDCHKLLVDLQAAAVVKKIFAMAHDGSTIPLNGGQKAPSQELSDFLADALKDGPDIDK